MVVSETQLQRHSVTQRSACAAYRPASCNCFGDGCDTSLSSSIRERPICCSLYQQTIEALQTLMKTCRKQFCRARCAHNPYAARICQTKWESSLLRPVFTPLVCIRYYDYNPASAVHGILHTAASTLSLCRPCKLSLENRLLE